jgi:hypothetical protein
MANCCARRVFMSILRIVPIVKSLLHGKSWKMAIVQNVQSVYVCGAVRVVLWDGVGILWAAIVIAVGLSAVMEKR